MYNVSDAQLPLFEYENDLSRQDTCAFSAVRADFASCDDYHLHTNTVENFAECEAMIMSVSMLSVSVSHHRSKRFWGWVAAIACFGKLVVLLSTILPSMY